MPHINFDVLGRKLLKQYPYIANQLIIQPRLTNLNLVPEIFQHFNDRIDESQRDKTLIFLAVVVKLYDPDVIDGWKPRLIKGLRQQLSMTIGIQPTQISHLLQKVRDYSIIYADFANRVGYFYEIISKKYDDGQSKSISKG